MSAPDQKYDGPNKGYLRRAHSVFAVLGGLYLLIVILLSVPSLQTQLVIPFLAFALFKLRLTNIMNPSVYCI
jgi:hypothetical protein